MARLTIRSMSVLLSVRSNQMRSAATQFNIPDTAGRPGQRVPQFPSEIVLGTEDDAAEGGRLSPRYHVLKSILHRAPRHVGDRARSRGSLATDAQNPRWRRSLDVKTIRIG